MDWFILVAVILILVVAVGIYRKVSDTNKMVDIMFEHIHDRPVWYNK